ncbi:hypothetical protein PENTCL1PPCAC_8807, partial [Pristionchus entomophagus]
ILKNKLLADTLHDLPSTSLVDSTIRIAISREYTLTQLDVLGFPAVDPQYIYFMETGDDGARLILERYRHQILEHGRIMISTDEPTSDAFEALIPEVLERKVKRIMNADCGMFYTTNAQRDELNAVRFMP